MSREEYIAFCKKRILEQDEYIAGMPYRSVTWRRKLELIKPAVVMRKKFRNDLIVMIGLAHYVDWLRCVEAKL